MPQVPYNPVPQVGPQQDATPRYTADVTPDMFGANIGQAVSRLGSTADQVGNEIFARGLAMQDLANHSEAQEATAKFMKRTGDIYANLDSMQGKDAVDYYANGFEADLQKAHEDIGATLSNPMSRKLFSSEALSTIGRSMMAGARYAGAQNKVYALGASQSKIDAISGRTLLTPADEDSFQDGLQDTEDEVRSQGALKGRDPEAIDQDVAQAKSSLWAQRIRGMARSEPITAGKWLAQAAKDGEIQGEDLGKLKDYVDNQRRGVGSRMVSNQVFSGAGNRWGQGTVDIKAAGEAIGEIESSGNYSAIGVQTAHGKALGKYQVMEEFLPDFLKKAGLPAMSADEFLKNHSAQDAVFSANFGAYMKQTGSANDAASMWLTGKPMSAAGDAKDAHGTNAQMYVRRFNAALAKGAPLSAKVAMGRSIAEDQASDDPLMGDAVQQRVELDHNQQIAIKRDDIWQAQQPIENALTGGLPGGKIPTSPEDLQVDPKAAAAWDRLGGLNPAKQRYYIDVMARHAKGDHALTSVNLPTYLKFTGMANDPDRAADFVDDSTSKAILDSDIPITKKSELLQLQQKMRGKNDMQNPQIVQAMRILGPDMQAAGIDNTDKDKKAQFVGTLADELRQFSQDNTRPPKFEEIRKIGARLLQNMETPGRVWGTNTYPVYQVPIPYKDLVEARAKDPTISDWDAQREYTRQLYKEKFGKSPKAAASPSAPAPPAMKTSQ
jgi:hypothetical protein